MGRNPKNKKKKRAASSNSKRNNFKDFSSTADEDELLHDEITAVLSIFDESEIVAEKPLQINIKLRPYDKGDDAGVEKHEVSGILSVRIMQGYPSKVPKLQITEEEGLSNIDVDNLLSILHEQASINSRDGRVMIFNLVEAAREFLTGVKPANTLPESTSPIPESCQDVENIANYDIVNDYVEGPFVYGLIDLFGGWGEYWHGEGRTLASSDSVEAHTLSDRKNVKKAEKLVQPLPLQDAKVDPTKSNVARPKSYSKDLVMFNYESEKLESYIQDSEDETYESRDVTISQTESEASRFSSSSSSSDKKSKYNERDLMMVHLLRLVCASKGSLLDSVSHISAELCDLGIISENIQDLVCKPSSEFSKIFDDTFGRHMASSNVSEFWDSLCNVEEPDTNHPTSRYLEDFDELQTLGHGGFGHVTLCKNKLDGRQYAVKKIRIKEKTVNDNDRILREVATLARLQHQNVVRYYQAWWETGIYSSLEDTCSSFDSKSLMTTATKIDQENGAESTYLYIQMEYCPRTLRKILDANYCFDMDIAWLWFRQIVEGLAHIHGQGIIHRDLTPNNIFFDSRNDVKIGDFGLAKFLQLEHLDHETIMNNEFSGMSIDGSNQVGTYYYTAPEIEQGWPKIDQKADMYSLGIVFFELWHPFTTGMERSIILSNLKKGEVSSAWMDKFPEQVSLLKRLLSPIPSYRPSATDLLKNDFPPRMEYELLESMLKTMHASDDRTVYDKVVDAIFDDESLALKSHHHQQAGRLRVAKDDISCTTHAEARDSVFEVASETFKLHGAKHVEFPQMHLMGDCVQPDRQNAVRLLTQGGDIIELSHELRHQFASWIAACQKYSFRRYEISSVYRRAIGRCPPSCYLQGDFDIVGGSTSLTEAEAIKVTMDIVNNTCSTYTCDIHLNHGHLIEAIWSWVGIKHEHRQKVSELLLIIQSWQPQSPERKSKWAVVRRQLLQELNLAESVINRLNTALFRFCGSLDKALPRLRGALTMNNSTRKALDELTDLHRYLELWKVQNAIYVDPTMLPVEYYHRDLYFQVYLVKNNEKILVSSGGRCDHLLREKWNHFHSPKSSGSASVGVGTSLALSVIADHWSHEAKPWRSDATSNVLVCSKGGGGLLEARMELVAELWEHRVNAQFVPKDDPSLMEQYDYASVHDIKCLVIVTETGVSNTGFVKVRHLEVKKEKEVKREMLVKFLFTAFASQFRNPSLWI